MADQSTPQTAFQRFLAETGDRQAAALLKVKERTVKSWRRGERMPRPEAARDIVTRIPITLADIYGNAA